MVRATVLIPTHNHGPLLRLAATSALAQTVADLEVFIVLDGPDAATRAAAEEVARSDTRVRLFPNPKGERNGEAHRHVALQEARGRIVCYLSDDDLWFPDHVEYLDGLLADADLAHSLTVVAHPGGGFHLPYVGDLADPWYRRWLAGPHNFIPLAATGHTLAAYRSLAEGWSPAPPGVWTDLNMWRKFLARPDLRMVTGGRPTMLGFPSPARLSMDLAQRLSEMESWHARLQQPGAWEALRRQATDLLSLRAAELQRDGLAARAEFEAERDRLTESEAALAKAREELTRSWAEVTSLRAELDAVRTSITYRAGYRLASIPVIGRLGRWVGKALAGRPSR